MCSPVNGRIMPTVFQTTDFVCVRVVERKIGCSYELAELTDSLGDVGEESAERLRAELVAMLSCFLVCSCIMLGEGSAR